MRKHGAGSIYQRARDGKWIASVSVRGIDGRTRRREFVAATEAEAKRRLQNAKDSGLLRRASYDQRPIKDFAAEWVEHVKTLKKADGQLRYKATTRDGYERDVRLYIAPHLGTVRLADLDRKIVAAWATKLQRIGIGAAAIGRARRTLSKMLSVAVSQDLIPLNPAQGLDRDSIPSYRPPEARTLDLEQIKTLFREAYRYRYGSMMIVAATTAARQAELIGLRWSDLDLEKSRLTIQRNLVLVNKKFEEGTPKTESSERIVALPAVARDALREHRAAMRKEKRDLDAGLVWLTADGNPVRRDNLLKEVLYPALQHAALPKITWHQLRHSCATLLIELGVPLEAVSRTLGHKDPGVTLRVYNKAFRGRERLAAEALDVAFAGTPNRKKPAGSRRQSAVKAAVKASKSAPSAKGRVKKKPR